MFWVCALQEKHVFKNPRPKRPKALRIYEAHVGMSSTVRSVTPPPSPAVAYNMQHYNTVEPVTLYPESSTNLQHCTL